MSSASASSGSEFETQLPHIDDGSRFIHHTSFDAYFELASKSSKTSSNVFSQLVPPLTKDEYNEAITPFLAKERRGLDTALHQREFWLWDRELEEGFNLLFYGYGSKRQVLNEFAQDVCSTKGNVIIANGYLPTFTIRDLLSSIDQVPEVASAPSQGPGVDGQAARIRKALDGPNTRPLYLVIHNIDSHALRSAKARSCLELLALSPNIRIVASMDHVNAPLLFSSSSLSARKRPLFRDSAEEDEGAVPTRGFSFLWHDLTTLAPYEVELAHADRSSISGASVAASKSNAAESDAQAGATMSESAVQHVLASVTAKAKKLFVLMARRQLDEASAAGDAATDMQAFSVPYDVLFTLCRDAFIATTDGALRALLGEFRDHGIVRTASLQGGGREGLWIPMRKERLEKVLGVLEKEG